MVLLNDFWKDCADAGLCAEYLVLCCSAGPFSLGTLFSAASFCKSILVGAA